MATDPSTTLPFHVPVVTPCSLLSMCIQGMGADCESASACVPCSWSDWLRGQDQCGESGWHRSCDADQTIWEGCDPGPGLDGPSAAIVGLFGTLCLFLAVLSWRALFQAVDAQAQETSATLRALARGND